MGDKKVIDGKELDNIIVEAVFKALDANGIRYDVDDGAIFMHLDGVKETWCLNDAHKCEEYEAPDAE